MGNYLLNRDASSSFNRYMVECELQSKAMFPSMIYRFNRYMVECEYFSAS